MFAVKLNSEMKSQRKRMTVCEKRSAELDRLIKKLIEEHALGSMSGKRFDLLSSEYEKEQEMLETEIEELRVGIDSMLTARSAPTSFLHWQNVITILLN